MTKSKFEKCNKLNGSLDFPFTETLINDASNIRPMWNLDEQQADPIHRNFSLSKLKCELRKLLAIAQKSCVCSCGSSGTNDKKKTVKGKQDDNFPWGL